MRCYIKAFKNYFNGNGRATRKELWLFFLFHYLIIFILSILDAFFGFFSNKIPLDYGYLTLAYLLISICPTVCVQIRRLHDVNKSGTWWLLFNVPFISLYVLYLYLKRGDSESNNYGPPSEQHRRNAREPKVQIYTSLPEQKNMDHLPDTPALQSNCQPQSRFCRKCGYELIAGSKFCSKCGTPIVKEQSK